MNNIHPSAERIIKFMAGKKRATIGVQGVSYNGKLYFKLIRNQMSGLISVAWYQGSITPNYTDLTDLSDEELQVIGNQIYEAQQSSLITLYNIIA